MTQTPNVPPPIGMTMAPPVPLGPQKRAVGLAIAALILGLIGLVPCIGQVTGLPALILGIVALAKKTTAKGMAIVGIIGPIVGVIILIIMMAMGMSVLGGFGGVKNMAQCQVNLHAIGAGVQQYKAHNNDAYPPNLEALVGAGSVQQPMLQCPAAATHRPCDYFYLPPAAGAPGNMLIACDFTGNHPLGRCTLLANGMGTFLDEASFQQTLAKPENAAFAAALRQAEGR
jgi:hypothetical protein